MCAPPRLFSARRRPGPLELIALATAVWVIACPFAVSRYAPMTDLPFHAAHTAILRHYADADWHLAEQFRLQPFSVPYLSMYAIGALAMLAAPPLIAVKIAAAAMVALLPIGLAALLDGLKKSPLLSLAALPLAWGDLTHWGFLNFVGAIGLFAMAVGIALKILDRPTPARRIALALVLAALFFTHVFRFPFAVAALGASALIAARRPRQLGPLVLPVAAPVALFAAWFFHRPPALQGDPAGFGFHPERLGELPGFLFGGCADPARSVAARAGIALVAATLLVVLAARSVAALRAARRPMSRPALVAAVRATAVPLLCALVSLGLFVSLPMKMGDWWYVYPREATAAVFFALAAGPDLPRAGWLRGTVVLSLCAAGALVGGAVSSNYAQFDAATEDFFAITRAIPAAPKLLYLVFDNTGSTCSNAPFLHLPAYVQAERGGWLSFNFVIWGATPMAFRGRDEPGSVVPPPTTPLWEWRPADFRVEEHGPFFNWFLVRKQGSPDAIFSADTTIERVDHRGTWWLYRRRAERDRGAGELSALPAGPPR